METRMIYNKKYGKCELIGYFKNTALIKLKDRNDKYIVAVGFSLRNNDWNDCYYCSDYNDAILTYVFVAFD